MQLLSEDRHWLWLVPLLLLAVALASSVLDDKAFDADEASSVLRIGGKGGDPYSLAEVRVAVLKHSPDQALGWPLLLSLQARFMGWSEVALRSLSLFGGLLAVAWSWRAGREMFGPAAGFVAAALLASSLFFVTWMAIARVFTLLVFFTVLALHSYWRVALRPAAPGLAARAGLLVGAVGLLYAHYFGALLLPALALFHLLFVRKDRRWWQTLLIFLLAALAFLPGLELLLRGMEFSATRLGAENLAMAPHVALARIIEVYSNGLLHLLPKVAAALFVLASALALYVAWRRRRTRRAPDASWLLICVTLILVTLILGANEIVGVLISGRERYAFGLWPLFSLLTGLGFYSLARHRPAQLPLFSALLALMLLTGVVGNVRSSLRVRYVYHLIPPPLHLAMRDLEPAWRASDRLVIDQEVWSFPRSPEVYTGVLGESRLLLQTQPPAACDAVCVAETVATVQQQAGLWLLLGNPAGKTQLALQQALTASGRVQCRTTDYMQPQKLVLMLFAPSAADCG